MMKGICRAIFTLIIVHLCASISIPGDVDDSGRKESLESVPKSYDAERVQLGQGNEKVELIEQEENEKGHIDRDAYAYFEPKSRISRDTSIKDKIKKKVTSKIKGKHGKRKSGGPEGTQPTVYLITMLGMLTMSSSHISYLLGH